MIFLLMRSKVRAGGAPLAALKAAPGDDPGAYNRDLEQWLTASDGWHNAQLAVESAADEARLAVPRPDLNLTGTVGSVLAGTGAGTRQWSAAALAAAEADGLRSQWQTVVAIQSLRDVQDQLDCRWAALPATD